jgi:hypothetical protein
MLVLVEFICSRPLENIKTHVVSFIVSLNATDLWQITSAFTATSRDSSCAERYKESDTLYVEMHFASMLLTVILFY